jgi:hypothetical protein
VVSGDLTGMSPPAFTAGVNPQRERANLGGRMRLSKNKSYVAQGMGPYVCPCLKQNPIGVKTLWKAMVVNQSSQSIVLIGNPLLI